MMILGKPLIIMTLREGGLGSKRLELDMSGHRAWCCTQAHCRLETWRALVEKFSQVVGRCMRCLQLDAQAFIVCVSMSVSSLLFLSLIASHTGRNR